MSLRVKYCGLTRAEDVAAAAASPQVTHLGFVLVAASPRAVSPEQAEALRAAIPKNGPQAVALFQNSSAEAVHAALAVFKPALLQFHGDEDAAFCRQFGLPYWKAVPMGRPQRWADWEAAFPDAQALLADSHGGSGIGGTGHRFDWAQLPPQSERRLPLILAGGLTAETVGQGIATVCPAGVDVSSGIEQAKGIKEPLKMRAFVAAVRAADAK